MQHSQAEDSNQEQNNSSQLNPCDCNIWKASATELNFEQLSKQFFKTEICKRTTKLWSQQDNKWISDYIFQKMQLGGKLRLSQDVYNHFLNLYTKKQIGEKYHNEMKFIKQFLNKVGKGNQLIMEDKESINQINKQADNVFMRHNQNDVNQVSLEKQYKQQETIEKLQLAIDEKLIAMLALNNNSQEMVKETTSIQPQNQSWTKEDTNQTKYKIIPWTKEDTEWFAQFVNSHREQKKPQFIQEIYTKFEGAYSKQQIDMKYGRVRENLAKKRNLEKIQDDALKQLNLKIDSASNNDQSSDITQEKVNNKNVHEPKRVVWSKNDTKKFQQYFINHPLSTRQQIVSSVYTQLLNKYTINQVFHKYKEIRKFINQNRENTNQYLKEQKQVEQAESNDAKEETEQLNMIEKEQQNETQMIKHNKVWSKDQENQLISLALNSVDIKSCYKEAYLKFKSQHSKKQIRYKIRKILKKQINNIAININKTGDIQQQTNIVSEIAISNDKNENTIKNNTSDKAQQVQQNNQNEWNEEETQLFTNIFLQNQEYEKVNWNKFQAILPQKSIQSLQEHFMLLQQNYQMQLVKSSKKKEWTNDEIKTLMDQVQQYKDAGKTIIWTEVSQKLNRTYYLCKKQYQLILQKQTDANETITLNDDENKSSTKNSTPRKEQQIQYQKQWTQQEIGALLLDIQLFKSVGKKVDWTEVSQKLNRAILDCKKQYQNLTKELNEQNIAINFNVKIRIPNIFQSAVRTLVANIDKKELNAFAQTQVRNGYINIDEQFQERYPGYSIQQLHSKLNSLRSQDIMLSKIRFGITKKRWITEDQVFLRNFLIDNAGCTLTVRQITNHFPGLEQIAYYEIQGIMDAIGSEVNSDMLIPQTKAKQQELLVLTNSEQISNNKNLKAIQNDQSYKISNKMQKESSKLNNTTKAEAKWNKEDTQWIENVMKEHQNELNSEQLQQVIQQIYPHFIEQYSQKQITSKCYTVYRELQQRDSNQFLKMKTILQDNLNQSLKTNEPAHSDNVITSRLLCDQIFIANNQIVTQELRNTKQVQSSENSYHIENRIKENSRHNQNSNSEHLLESSQKQQKTRKCKKWSDEQTLWVQNILKQNYDNKKDQYLEQIFERFENDYTREQIRQRIQQQSKQIEKQLEKSILQYSDSTSYEKQSTSQSEPNHVQNITQNITDLENHMKPMNQENQQFYRNIVEQKDEDKQQSNQYEEINKEPTSEQNVQEEQKELSIKEVCNDNESSDILQEQEEYQQHINQNGCYETVWQQEEVKIIDELIYKQLSENKNLNIFELCDLLKNRSFSQIQCKIIKETQKIQTVIQKLQNPLASSNNTKEESKWSKHELQVVREYIGSLKDSKSNYQLLQDFIPNKSAKQIAGQIKAMRSHKVTNAKEVKTYQQQHLKDITSKKAQQQNTSWSEEQIQLLREYLKSKRQQQINWEVIGSVVGKSVKQCVEMAERLRKLNQEE